MAQNEGTELRGAVPPSSVEAEISVLGAMMLDPNAVEKATETLRAEDFFLAEHQEIYSAMAALHDLRRPVDLTTVEAELRRRGSLEGVGGVVSLMKLQTAVPATANVGMALICDFAAPTASLTEMGPDAWDPSGRPTPIPPAASGLDPLPYRMTSILSRRRAPSSACLYFIHPPSALSPIAHRA